MSDFDVWILHEQTAATPVNPLIIRCGSCCLPAARKSFWSFFSLDSTQQHSPHFYFLCFYGFHVAGSACRVAAVSWFEFQNLSDWLPILTADDLMETLLSGALKNRRMIYNETQPLSLFWWGGWGGGGGGGGWVVGCELWVQRWTLEFLCSLSFWRLCFGVTKSSHYILLRPETEFSFMLKEKKRKKEEKYCLQTCGALMHI